MNTYTYLCMPTNPTMNPSISIGPLAPRLHQQYGMSSFTHSWVSPKAGPSRCEKGHLFMASPMHQNLFFIMLKYFEIHPLINPTHVGWP